MALIINYTSQTNIQVTVPMTWKDEYKEAIIFYTFIIQVNNNKYYILLIF